MMCIKWEIKWFDALTTVELYDILQLRSDVFVVEQNCVYLDIDGKDKKALHLFGLFDKKIVAHARLLPPGVSFVEASIGRVVVDKAYRNKKLGHELMQKAIEAITFRFGEKTIVIGAQSYLKKFYESHGFVAISSTYLEDGIPHITMRNA